ncbi:hypothetical protein [Coxiella-like endosymbiont]|uniref:hypothetical protein n=1 Tax=Coxiella-like endosymbiont TaxID=1592897 RepID=UPI00272CDA2B|nr:hypothetical protein [Coxiella-like endosymbiont]
MRFYLPQKTKDKQMKWDPKSLPSMDLTINDFRYGKNVLGKLILQTSQIKNGLNINNFTAIGLLFYIKAAGKWQHKKTKQKRG